MAITRADLRARPRRHRLRRGRGRHDRPPHRRSGSPPPGRTPCRFGPLEQIGAGVLVARAIASPTRGPCRASAPRPRCRRGTTTLRSIVDPLQRQVSRLEVVRPDAEPSQRRRHPVHLLAIGRVLPRRRCRPATARPAQAAPRPAAPPPALWRSRSGRSRHASTSARIGFAPLTGSEQWNQASDMARIRITSLLSRR